MTLPIVSQPVALPPGDLHGRFRVAKTMRQNWENTWACQMLAVAFVILEDPDKAQNVTSALGNLDTIWTVGLSVLGIYVYKRSQEKRRPQ